MGIGGGWVSSTKREEMPSSRESPSLVTQDINRLLQMQSVDAAATDQGGRREERPGRWRREVAQGGGADQGGAAGMRRRCRSLGLAAAGGGWARRQGLPRELGQRRGERGTAGLGFGLDS